ncbi:hypothetical protein FRACA_1700014 [Frankia canadensis]|uniref:Uncharacterized protein n=1 Tax=Frankia canadensis TaxID=1836972 RepID=A0A2I2KNA2_9ACTN|nr:hypothetical protein FRACA_1700014 [Frankia canadensis]SOU54412.1 hypothetical protein FRACA_1700014 [Frankia canadensis]
MGLGAVPAPGRRHREGRGPPGASPPGRRLVARPQARDRRRPRRHRAAAEGADRRLHVGRRRPGEAGAGHDRRQEGLIGPRWTWCMPCPPMPGRYDRIVSVVSVPFIPPSWPAALRPGGRLVTTTSGTHIVGTAANIPRGFVRMVEFEDLDVRDGEHVGPGRCPVLHVAEALELSSLFTLAASGVRQGGQRRLWDSAMTGSAAASRSVAVNLRPAWRPLGGEEGLWMMRGTRISRPTSPTGCPVCCGSPTC